MADGQATAIRQHIANNVGGAIVAIGSGTTSGTINTAATVAHGAKDHNGNPYPVANLVVLPISRNNVAVYNGAAPTATLVDIRSATASVPYDFIVFLKN